MSNCYLVDDNGRLTKLSCSDVKSIAIRNGANADELTMSKAKCFIDDKAMRGNAECENVCFSYSEACAIARDRK